MGRVSKPVQRIVIIVLALVLVLPIGFFGLSELIGPREQPSASPTDGPDRPAVDPADQPPRPEIPKPAEPAAMTQQTPEGAEATLAYLLDSYTYMMTTGDTSVWSNSVDPSCQVCTTFLGNAEQLHEQGGYLVDGEFTVERTSFTADGDASGTPTAGSVTATFSQEASTIIDDPTLQGGQLDAVSGDLAAQMTWDGQRWRVLDMSITPTGGASDGGGGAG